MGAPEAREASTRGVRGGVRVRDGLCGICPAGCWVRAHVEGDRLVGVEPLPDHPLGMLCTIGRHSPEIVHSPDRVNRPLRRTGPKGRYAFEPISWDAAYALLAGRLASIKREHGAEATAVYTGRGAFELSLCDVFQPAGVAVSSASSVLFPFGSPNTLGVGALCYVAFAMIAPHVTMGAMLLGLDADLDQAELVVLWGANPATDSPPTAHHQVVRARQRGAQVIAIDPRRNDTARAVDAEWIPIRPGTDGALALALIEVLLEEELHDEEFARDWTVGFEDLARLAQHYRPERVEGITGVPAATIRSLARRIAAARGACPVTYTGLEYSGNGVQAIRALLTLWGLAGQLDVPGGLVFRMRDGAFPQNRRHLQPNPAVGKALGRERFPLYTRYRGESHAIALPRSVLEGDPYRIRALVVHGASILTAWPDPELWRRTLAGLDFLVCVDRFLTADAAFADLVLPAATGYEITSYMRYGPLFKIREPLVPPVGEARNDFLIMAGLADRLGYGHLYPQTEEALLRHALEGTGFTLEAVRAAGGEARVPAPFLQYRKWEKGLLRPDGEPGFDTPSGRFEIASSILAEHGYEPLPVYVEPPESPASRPDLAGSHPLVFNSGARGFHDFRSQHHGVPGLAARAPEPLATLSAEDAAARGIASGDPVWVETPRGRAPFRAHVTADLVPGAIDASMGGGGPLGSASWRACNVNALTDLAQCDPISGFPVYKALLCEVRRADGAAAAEPAEGAPERDAPRGPRIEAAPLRPIYLDHAATTPVAPAVAEAMAPFLAGAFGNPSSVHPRGAEARAAVEDARRKVARALECTARRVVFTGSGSESDNLAVKGAAWACRARGRHVVTSAIEHPAVLEACRALVPHGFELTVVPVERDGHVSPERVLGALRDDTVLVSLMLVNNEVGTIQPVAALAPAVRARGALLHADAVQALGKVALDVEALGVDLLTVSAHKIHGPKGVGALYVRAGVSLEPLVHGGGQEHGLRAGTENVAGVVGFGRACELAMQRLGGGEMDRLAALRDRLEAGLLRLLPEARRNGDGARIATTLDVTLPGIRGESLVLALGRRAVHLSSGSACHSGDPEPSRTLLAMGLTPEEAHCSVRFSLGAGQTEADVDEALARIAETLAASRAAVRFLACR
ncbi:aminotransferase class V-fold PLP-dependent enzyme [Anaeromyxobacter sp. SG17]|uniref:aminotransferase class V-fold PLP-dependent enzyme n=1 Tax=Anaeromyxobacter sp. SG17 TaxID=2925405 RepID=UPI001F586D32|nr:aminotransferase class V-fold PLP-dependent enzyme [Anaeromyxobacter sp. SG17]